MVWYSRLFKNFPQFVVIHTVKGFSVVNEAQVDVFYTYICRASQVALVIKNLPANTGDMRDVGSVLGFAKSPQEGMATHSSVLAWKIPWTEEPGWLQSMGSQRVRHD